MYEILYIYTSLFFGNQSIVRLIILYFDTKFYTYLIVTFQFCYRGYLKTEFETSVYRYFN